MSEERDETFEAFQHFMLDCPGCLGRGWVRRKLRHESDRGDRYTFQEERQPLGINVATCPACRGTGDAV